MHRHNSVLFVVAFSLAQVKIHERLSITPGIAAGNGHIQTVDPQDHLPIYMRYGGALWISLNIYDPYSWYVVDNPSSGEKFGLQWYIDPTTGDTVWKDSYYQTRNWTLFREGGNGLLTYNGGRVDSLVNVGNFPQWTPIYLYLRDDLFRDPYRLVLDSSEIVYPDHSWSELSCFRQPRHEPQYLFGDVLFFNDSWFRPFSRSLSQRGSSCFWEG
jgi:hypothetical protein